LLVQTFKKKNEVLRIKILFKKLGIRKRFGYLKIKKKLFYLIIFIIKINYYERHLKINLKKKEAFSIYFKNKIG